MINIAQRTHHNHFAHSRLPDNGKKEDIICLSEFRKSFLVAQEQLSNEKKEGCEADLPCVSNIPFAVFNIIAEPTENDARAVLNGLREKFGIPINVMGTPGLPALDELNNYNGGDTRMLNISVGLLYKMAGDPEEHRKISEKIQRWLDGSSEFLDKVGGEATNMTMSITEYSELYGYGMSQNATDSDYAKAKEAWEELIDYLLKWLDERNDDYSKKEISECLFEILL